VRYEYFTTSLTVGKRDRPDTTTITSCFKLSANTYFISENILLLDKLKVVSCIPARLGCPFLVSCLRQTY